MKLISSRIRDYKCIEDSDRFTIGPVTCLVGKNEAGKTAILEALHKLNPDVATKFSDLDYPRRKWQPRMDASVLPKDVVETEWQVEDADKEVLASALGVDPLRDDSVVVKCSYENEKSWTVRLNEELLVQHILEGANLSAPESDKIRNADSVANLIAGLEAVPEPTDKQQKLLATLRDEYKGGTAALAVIDLLRAQLPHFLYFNEYYILPGQVALVDFEQRRAQSQLDHRYQVFEALLALAGTSANAIKDISTFDRLRASLEAVSNRLSDEIFEYWSQNSHLEVSFSFDNARPEDPAPFNSGYVFRTSIRNTRHKATVSFDERSSGFVWFFSFLVWFSQVREKYGERLVILLDEPALNLHARAQADLLRYIAERLAPHHQVIYTTHSPFMVDPDNLEWTRTVEDVVHSETTAGRTREQLLGTKVSDDVLAVDPDTISPLQGALGYDITQTLFVGKNTLLVEGPSDLIFFKWFSYLLHRRQRKGLSNKWTICPVGGIDKISSFAALFGANALRIAVVTDFHQGEKAKIRTLKEGRLLKAGHVFTADQYIEGDDADIEDIVGRANYCALVDAAYDLTGEQAMSNFSGDLSARVVVDVAAHFACLPPEFPEYDHYHPAVHALQNSDAVESVLPDLDAALDRFERLFQDVNAILEDAG